MLAQKTQTVCSAAFVYREEEENPVCTNRVTAKSAHGRVRAAWKGPLRGDLVTEGGV